MSDAPVTDLRDDPDMGTLHSHVIDFVAEQRALGHYTGSSPKVVRVRLTGLADYFGRRPLSHLTEKAMIGWMASMPHLAQASRCAYWSSACAFCAWLVRTHRIRVDPTRDLPKPKRPDPIPRAFDPMSIAAILAAVADERERAVVMLMLGMGLRAAEVARVRWADYDQRDQIMVVTGKGGRSRWLPVPEAVQRVLALIPGHAEGPIIRNQIRPWAPLSPCTISLMMSDLIKRAGVKQAPWDGKTGHAFRHTCASDVLDQCGDLRVVQQVLGHASLSSTQIYLRRASAEKLRNAMEGRRYAA